MAIATATRQLSVLVCDDERAIARLLQAILERRGHTVTVALDGDEALEEIRNHRFDVVVLDLVMPRVGGLQVLAWIRQRPELSDLPVIILSARHDDDEVFDAYRRGADIYLNKPIDPNELLRFIERV